MTFIFQLSTFLSCCVERITFGYLFESKYACLVQFYIHFFAVGKVHDNFVVTCELQQFGRFAVCFYAPTLVCFIENQIDRFLQSKLHGRAPEDKEKKRLTDALLRRGFSWGEVKSAWGRYGSEVWED